MRICLCPLATLSSFRAHRTSKTVVKRKFCSGRRNPLVTSCWSDVRNCGEMVIFVCRGLQGTSCAGFIHFCARHCSKTYIFKFWMARRCSDTRMLLFLDEPSRAWDSVGRLHETVVKCKFSVEIVGSLARNARFGSFFCEISRKPRVKRSFWKLVL